MLQWEITRTRLPRSKHCAGTFLITDRCFRVAWEIHFNVVHLGHWALAKTAPRLPECVSVAEPAALLPGGGRNFWEVPDGSCVR
jgi:hypothetical protein